MIVLLIIRRVVGVALDGRLSSWARDGGLVEGRLSLPILASNNFLRDTFGFLLERIARAAVDGSCRKATGALLHHMRQFVSKELLALDSFGDILSASEVDVASGGVGAGGERVGGLCRIVVGMYSYIREVVLEARLHEFTGRAVQGMSGSFERELAAIYEWRRGCDCASQNRRQGLSLQQA